MLLLSVASAWHDGVRRPARVRLVRLGEDWIVLELRDGRLVRLPAAWLPALASASDRDRDAWCLLAGGAGVAWPAVGEVLLLRALPGRRDDPGREERALPHLRLAQA